VVAIIFFSRKNRCESFAKTKIDAKTLAKTNIFAKTSAKTLSKNKKFRENFGENYNFGKKQIILIKLLHNFSADNFAKTKVFATTKKKTKIFAKFRENLIILAYFSLFPKMKKSVFVSTLLEITSF
jgi:hypothetical protein